VNAKQGLAFIERHGIVLQAARGPVPSLAEAIAEGPIRGSWWGHAKGNVHRRLWPALVKLAARFRKEQLVKTCQEHTPTGAHRTRRMPFPEWVPSEVLQQAARLSVPDAERMLAPWSSLGKSRRRP
jgi:hypothetical protein